MLAGLPDRPIALRLEELDQGGLSPNYSEELHRLLPVWEFLGQGKLGPAGVVAPGARVGVFTMAPGTVYPAHRHPAPEVYVVVGGACRLVWAAGETSAVLRPISFVYHPPNAEHAIESVGDDELRMVYVWWGDEPEIVTGGQLT
jgi:mannose-6-phosphate isomerase-like protein (cupin superfamily)